MTQARVFLSRRSRSDLYDLVWNWNLKEQGDCGRFVRGSKCRTLDTLFDEFSAALQFPSYFGYNWDAFDECIGDLEWTVAERILVVIVDAEEILSTDRSHRSIFLRCINHALTQGSGRLDVLFGMASETEAAFRLELTAAEITIDDDGGR